MTALPFLFGGVRLILGLVILIKTLGMFGQTANPDSFFKKRQGVSVVLATFLILSGLYTLLFSTVDTYNM
ncbi:hypothetical protein H8B13_05700 [Hymenobacter sp. BT188]|uniref:hypothetical protein n=1 Tax=Hymenobacter sp. BT188 TaxID=2763504 RepID=UPI001651563F|nr:hypothetical protein [Hymenobacter sp. BT188]MBC6606302.1 hypothetical protein [Hymenobacter sp. BT188]